MKKFYQNNKIWLITSSYIITIIVTLIISSILSPVKIITKPVTNVIQGNTVYIPKYSTITNWLPYYADLDNYDTDSFVFTQTGDKVKVDLYKRSAVDILYDFHIEKAWSIGAIGIIDKQGPAAGPAVGYSQSWFDLKIGGFYGSTNNYGIIGNADIRF